MKVTPVDHKPVEQRPPANIAKKDQTWKLYPDATDLKDLKIGTGNPGQSAMTALRLSGASPSQKFVPPNPGDVIKSYVAGNYDFHRADRGNKPGVGLIIDTLA